MNGYRPPAPTGSTGTRTGLGGVSYTPISTNKGWGERSSGALFVDPNNDAQDLQRNVVEAQEADFNKRYKPLESELLKQLKPKKIARKAAKDAEVAGYAVRRQGKITRGAFLRDMARTGVRLDRDQKDALKRRRGLAKATAKADVKNNIELDRRADADARRASLISVGKGIQDTAGSNLSSAANMQQNREANNAAAKTQQKGQTMSMIGTGLGIAASFFL